jgi:hypothetical protein
VTQAFVRNLPSGQSQFSQLLESGYTPKPLVRNLVA